MQHATIKSWKDGDSCETTTGTKLRLANVHMPDRTDVGYTAAKRNAQQLVPDGDEIEYKVVGRDQYGRKLVEMRHNGRNINTTMARRFPEHR